jgi:hypothetical protein
MESEKVMTINPRKGQRAKQRQVFCVHERHVPNSAVAHKVVLCTYIYIAQVC